MRRSSGEERLIYSLAAYVGVSLLLTALNLLFALAAAKGLAAVLRFAFGPAGVCRVPGLYDSAGFALASAGTALTQYYLVSLLRLAADENPFLAVFSGLTALLCGLLFARAAAQSSLGAYPLSGLCVTLAALLGAGEAVFQKASENPWPPSVGSFFT